MMWGWRYGDVGWDVVSKGKGGILISLPSLVIPYLLWIFRIRALELFFGWRRVWVGLLLIGNPWGVMDRMGMGVWSGMMGGGLCIKSNVYA